MTRKIKYTRKDLKSPDEFISTVGRATLWAKENRTLVTAILASAILVFGGGLGARAYFQWQENRAARDLWPHMSQAREYLQTPQAEDQEKLAALANLLEEQVKTHEDSRAAVYARYYLGSIAFLRGEYDQGISHFRSGIDSGKAEGTIMEFLIREGLAQSLEAKGDAENAQKVYGEAAGFASGELRTQAWMGQARALTILGRTEEATALFRKILAENPDTPLKELIELKLSRMG